MVTRPHSPWLALSHTGRGTGRRETGMLEDTRDGKQLQIVYLGYCSCAVLHSGGHLHFKNPISWPWELWLHWQDDRSHFLSVPPKISASFQADRRFFPVAPLRPHCPWFLNPSTHPLLSNPAALPLLCILHLLDYSTVSKHSTRVALNS